MCQEPSDAPAALATLWDPPHIPNDGTARGERPFVVRAQRLLGVLGGRGLRPQQSRESQGRGHWRTYARANSVERTRDESRAQRIACCMGSTKSSAHGSPVGSCRRTRDTELPPSSLFALIRGGRRES